MDFDANEMRRLTEACMEYSLKQIETIGEQPVVDLDGAAELALGFREPAPETPKSVEKLIERFGAAVRKTFNTASPSYLAFIPGGGIYPCTLAQYLAMSVNRFTGMWNAAPALVEMDRAAMHWIRDFIHLPKNFDGIFTSGGSLSNLIAIITARRTRLPENFFKGVIYLSREAHYCVPKAALLAGFPESNLRYIDVDEGLAMRVDSLRSSIESDLQKGLTPFMVVATPGTTNTGAIDPVVEIGEVCQQQKIWLHLDAAYGGFFRALNDGRVRLPGFELADSIVLDPHKGLFMPYGSGCLLMHEPDLLRQAHQLTAEYMQDLSPPAEGAVNFADVSPELTREFRGFRVWFAFQLYGVNVFRQQLQEKWNLAQWAYQELSELQGCQCFQTPQLSVVAFRFLPGRGDPCEFNRKLIERIRQTGKVFLTSTTIQGKFMLRLAILSFRTRPETVARALLEIRNAFQELSHSVEES